MDTDDEDMHEIMSESFLQMGRLRCDVQVLAWHPTYLKCYTACRDFVLVDDGPLPVHFRYYICLMASARFNCNYLVQHHKLLFLENGGPPEWLEGIKSPHVPYKLKQLSELNALLAHTPWKVTPKHIASLINDHDHTKDTWSITELVHAVTLISTYHAYAGFILGMGIVNEIDVDACFSSTSVYTSTASPTISELSEVPSEVSLGDHRSSSAAVYDSEDLLDLEEQERKVRERLTVKDTGDASDEEDEVSYEQTFEAAGLGAAFPIQRKRSGRRASEIVATSSSAVSSPS